MIIFHPSQRLGCARARDGRASLTEGERPSGCRHVPISEHHGQAGHSILIERSCSLEAALQLPLVLIEIGVSDEGRA